MAATADSRFLLQRYFGEVTLGTQAVAVACIGDRLVGQIWIRFRGSDPKISDDSRQAYVHTLFVHPANRRRGIGLALLKAASQLAVKRARCELVIAVDKPNRYAFELYRGWGFVVHREISDLRGELIFLRRAVFDKPEPQDGDAEGVIEFSIK